MAQLASHPKTTSSHEEGCTRRWNINTLEFLGKDGKLTGVKVQEIDWKPNPEGGRPIMVEKGEPEIIKAELVLLAMGFLKPEHPTYPENVFVYTFAMSWLGYKLIDSLIPMRVSEYSEKVGLDFSQHDEHYGLAHIGERELAEYEEHIREKNK